MARALPSFAVVPAVLTTLVIASCSPAAVQVPTQASPAATTIATSAASEGGPGSPPIQYTGKLSVSPTHAPAGAPVTVVGESLPADSSLDLMWNTAKGSWKLGGADHELFQGRDFQPVAVKLATVQTDAGGGFRATFTVPDGFGFQHDVSLMQGGVMRNKANFDVDMQVSATPSSGPVGTPISIVVKGIGYQYLYNSWQVGYDNKLTGWLSSVTTDGTARAVIPATGSPGKHLVQILSGAFTFPYLNGQQSPAADKPKFTMEFTVTDGPPVLPPPAETQGLASETASTPVVTSGPAIWTNLASGRILTPVTLSGLGFPANQPIDLLWFRVVGNRISGSGWDESSTKLGTVIPDATGSFQFPFKALDDLGGPHRIEARSGNNRLAQTAFTITPSAFPISPASGPPGTVFTVHLKGGGWTETSNIYMLVYDNAYLGYACAFNSQGDVTIHLPAAGSPGWHFIDLYPGIYKGTDANGIDNFRIPQLTYQDDHPGEKLPAFHFAFQVTNQ